MLKKILNRIRHTRWKMMVSISAILGFVGSTCWLFWYFEHNHPEQQELLRTPVDVLYWWVITCTTVGYGDISPKTQAGEILAIVVVLIGIGVVTTLLARAGSFFMQQRLQMMRGLGRVHNLQNHMIVCGWNDDISGILNSLVTHGGQVSPDKIVLINQHDPDKVNVLLSRKILRGIKLVAGDYTDSSDLKRCGVKHASQILILSGDEETPDSRTLLGVMAVRQQNRSGHLCAEVHEERFVKYMTDAGADEVIDPISFRRAMAAQILVSPGMGKVFYDLLSFDTGAFFGFENIPEDFTSKFFIDLQKHYATRDDVLLIGLMENVGNPIEMKREALHEAQKATDISQLVSQLQNVKQMSPRAPVLCPPGDHLISTRTVAVIIRRSQKNNGHVL
jgi:voltage-gated potassium channel